MFDPSKINFQDEKKEENKKDKNKDVLWSLWEENKKIPSKKKDNTFLLTKDDVNKEQETKEKSDEVKKEKIIFDINIKSVKDILYLLKDKEKNFSFSTFEVDEQKVKIDFRKDSKIEETKYIKYNVYNTILLKIKSISKLKLDETEKTQEAKTIITLDWKNYNLIVKIVPTSFWENLFLKLKETWEFNKNSKKEKKNNISQMFAFLWALIFISLIIGWSFLSFIVLNAKTVDDVKFFNSIGINLNQINEFIWKFVFIVFLLLTFILLVFLIIFLFKFLLTKKVYAKKRVRYWIVSLFLFILTFSTVSSWMYIAKKVENLPKWWEIIKWEVQLFDNAKLKSKAFDEQSAFITIDKVKKGLIWPVEIKFDCSVLKEQEADKWETILEYHWFFDWEEVIETDTEIVRNFLEKWRTDIELFVVERNSAWEVNRKPITNILKFITIKDIVKIKETPQETGWKLVSFDARSLKAEWEAEWYMMNDLEKPIATGYKYTTPEPIFKETLVWLYLRKKGKTSEVLDKIFVIRPEKKSLLDAKIEFEVDAIDDLKYSFRISDPKTDSWAWIIKQFIWNIWWKQYSKKWVYWKQEESSEIEHTFKKYGKQKIELKIIDSNWNQKIIKKEIEVEKKLRLTEWLKIYSNGIEVENIIYNSSLGTYYIKDLWVPADLSFDARDVSIWKILYSLEDVSWDFDWDGDADFKWKKAKLNLLKKAVKNNIVVTYTFKNRKLKDKFEIIKENISIDTIEKEAILNFKIKKDSEYVPINIWFDASMSKVTWKNISKFIWDFWDGETYEGWAVVQWHRYNEAWNYIVKLKVITEDWKIYSVKKSLVLTSTPDKLEIWVSLKEAPVSQEIDFDTSKSHWDIISYFWDFWDGETSIKSNPSHSYKKEWIYNVKLEASFRNKNIMKDSIKIKIY